MDQKKPTASVSVWAALALVYLIAFVAELGVMTAQAIL